MSRSNPLATPVEKNFRTRFGCVGWSDSDFVWPRFHLRRDESTVASRGGGSVPQNPQMVVDPAGARGAAELAVALHHTPPQVRSYSADERLKNAERLALHLLAEHRSLHRDYKRLLKDLAAHGTQRHSKQSREGEGEQSILEASSWS